MIKYKPKELTMTKKQIEGLSEIGGDPRFDVARIIRQAAQADVVVTETKPEWVAFYAMVAMSGCEIRLKPSLFPRSNMKWVEVLLDGNVVLTDCFPPYKIDEMFEPLYVALKENGAKITAEGKVEEFTDI